MERSVQHHQDDLDGSGLQHLEKWVKSQDFQRRASGEGPDLEIGQAGLTGNAPLKYAFLTPSIRGSLAHIQRI